MRKKLPGLILAAMLSIQYLSAQAVETNAKPSDWEEINFEFNQATIVDGFPALLRLAGLLKEHPDFKVTVTGNADQIGSDRYNQNLSMRRANAVAQFLQHYGANANQIQVQANGKKNPEVQGRGPNPRFVNRRVVLMVTAPDGTEVGDGSVAAAVREFERYVRAQLNKIDAILAQLHDLEDQVKALQGDTGTIKQTTASIQQSTTAIQQDTGAIKTDTRELVGRPSPLTAQQTTDIARAEATRAADYALMQAALRNRKYSLVGMDLGPTFANGSRYGSGKTGLFSGDLFARALIPFGNGRTPDEPGTHGLQIDGDWVYFRKSEHRIDGRNDGVFNIGLVNRYRFVQVGGFAQFDYVSLNAYQGGALLGAGVATIDFVMPGGVIGVFGAKGFRSYANLNTTPGTLASLVPAYLRYDDQIGFHASAAMGSRFQLDSNLAYVKRHLRGADKLPAASIKVSFLAGKDFAIFVQADENPTFQNLRNGDRLVFGFEFGHWLRPKHFGETQGVVPAYVPLPHYELLTR